MYCRYIRLNLHYYTVNQWRVLVFPSQTLARCTCWYPGRLDFRVMAIGLCELLPREFIELGSKSIVLE